MAFSSQKFYWGLRAESSLSRVNIAGTARIGYKQPQVINLGAVDIVHAFTITSTGNNDAAQLTLSTGQVVATVGSPTIDDEGVDFEGNALGTTVKLYAVLFEYTKLLSSLTIAHSGAKIPDVQFGDTGKIQAVWPAGHVDLGTIDYTFDAIGDSIKTTIFAATS